jgi:hypothetical protein
MLKIAARLLYGSFLVLLGLMWLLPVQKVQSGPTEDQNGLQLWIHLGPDLVDWFNRTAEAGDFAVVAAGPEDMLDKVSAGHRVLWITSIAEATESLPAKAGEVDAIDYRVDYPLTVPAKDWTDPVAAVQQMAELARGHNLRLAVSADYRIAQEYGSDLAAHADQFVLQVQRLQEDPSLLLDTAQPLARDLRQAEPDLAILVHLRLGSDLNTLLAIADALAEDIDGVSISYSPASADQVEEFGRRLKEGDPGALIDPTSTAGDWPDISMAPATAVTARPLPEPSIPNSQCTWPAGLVAIGCIVPVALVHYRRQGEDQ